jgi:hypothetical protein
MRNLRATAAGLFATLLLCAPPVHAGATKINISVTPQKDSGGKKRNGNVMQEETLFQYAVKLTNASFAAVSGLSAEYRVFIRDDSGKGAVSQQKLKRQEFSAVIPDMPNGGTYAFDTEPVKLQKSILDGNRYYVNGTRNTSQDKVAGVWIRIMQGDKVVGEYINPSTLAAKEKF